MPENPPVPDPTILTTEQLERAIKNLEDLSMARLKTVDDACTLRFETVKGQFILVERQRVEQKTDTKDAVDAAFSAAKEAVTKSETSTKEQLAGMKAEFVSALKGVSDLLDDVRTRVGRIESVRQGGQESRTEGRESRGEFYVLIATIVGVVGLIAAAYIGTH